MIREFEGKTRSEAIEKAIEELGLDREELDVEILEEGKGLFKKGPVKIRICIEDDEKESLTPESGQEEQILEFVTQVLDKMGYPGTCSIGFREENKIGIELESEHSGILIGKKGKNLDALQLLTNVFAGKIGLESVKFLLDIENYRAKREESLAGLARKTAGIVRKSKGSRLLDPMNPYERRIIHTTLNEYDDIHTVSEGDGLYKKVRVFFKETR